jgi:isoleucyl-tRNA synthetase
MTKDYKETLNMPKTSFPMRANLAKREPDFLKFWDDISLNNQLMKKRADSPEFILHDGPPYANGNIHIGTAFNKVLKDFIPKYKWMRGYKAPYVPGWDTHGLPIELHVLKSKGISLEEVDPVSLRKECTDYAYKYLDIQRDEFKRLGVLGFWDNPYVTLKPEYEAAEIGVFAKMVDKNLVYKGQKPVHWCIDCQTALAAAEIEYWDENSDSIYVGYTLPDISEKYEVLKGKETQIIVWTTTTWTLPASMAVAINPNLDYAFLPANGKIYLFAEGLIKDVAEATGLEFGDPVLKVKGKELEGVISLHPFYPERREPLVLADYVLLDQGTGCVHTAPGHGVEDYETGIRYGIEVYNPVDEKGVFVPETELVGNLPLAEAEKVILETLTESGRLLGKNRILHSYPHCWRCKKPVIFRSTDQWFVKVSQFRDKTLDIIEKGVQWIPEWGKERIYNMVRDRSDWCISRQRVWGVPIPAFYCNDCGKMVLSSDRIKCVQDLVREKGSSIWWELSPKELLGDLAVCPACGSTNLRKDEDIMDVWFDSGSSHAAVLETRDDQKWPADLYLEGSDQHRGWFQTSLLTSVATKSLPPYKAVLTHGFIVDGEGKKMSKSLGNVIKPQEIISKYGADILRLWVASTDYRNDVRISDSIIKNLTESYRKIRNTFRFLLGNLSDFDPSSDSVGHAQMDDMDKWILSLLNRLIDKTTAAYERYEFHMPTFLIHQFCVNELSSFFLEASKDRLYAEGKTSNTRRSCQTAMWQIVLDLSRILAPVLTFTTEETWQELRKIDKDLPESIYLSDWPEAGKDVIDERLEKNWEKVQLIKGAVSRALEKARSENLIGHPLEAHVKVEKRGPGENLSLYSEQEWGKFCIVSKFSITDSLADSSEAFLDNETGLGIIVSKAPGEKCPRCWKYTESQRNGLCLRCADVMDNI